jgi:hypothetical protein
VIFGTPGLALVRRELLSTLRRPRSFVVLALFVGASIAGIAFSWPTRQYQLSQLAALSNDLLQSISVMLFLASVLLVPALASAALVVEREEDTLDLLRVTLIRPSALLLAKLISVVGFFVLLLVAAIPVFSTVFFLVGIDWVALFEVVAVLLAFTVTCASAGLLSSATQPNITRAVMGGYRLMVLIFIITPFITLLLGFLVFLLNQMRFSLLPVLGGRLFMRPSMMSGNPIYMLGGIFSNRASVADVAVFVIVHGVIALFCLVVAYGALRLPPATPESMKHKPIDDPRRLRERRLTFPFYLVDPLKRKKPIEDGRNPVMVREVRWGLLDRADTMIRTFYIAFFTYVIIGGYGFFLRGRSSMGHDFINGWLLAQIIGTVAVSPAMLANTLTREYETGNIDMLRITLMSPGDIIRGKLFAGLTAAAPLLLAALGSAIPLLRGLRGEFDLLITGYVTLLLCTVLCLALALFASLLTTRTSTALVLTYLFTVAAFLGTAIAFSMVPRTGWLGHLHVLNSPISVFLDNAEQSTRQTVFTRYWIGNVAVFSAGALGLVGATIYGFTRYRLRDT